MIDLNTLRAKIIELAIKGKLVEQRPEEGTAEDLYAQIQEEKQKLIADKKIKKSKTFVEVSVDEIPFDIPKNWIWRHLGDISSYTETKQKIVVTECLDTTWTLDLEDIEKDTGKVLKRVILKDRPISGERKLFRKGEILYSKLRPYLKKILIAEDDGICSPELVSFKTYGNINNKYVLYFLKSAYVDNIVNAASYGIKMPRVGPETMANLLVPLPPLAEQKRIVEKLDAMLSVLDTAGTILERKKALNFKLKDKILQLAIQGKLVEQRPEEGTAEDLYAQIQEEKQKLIADKKIKKPKPISEITEEEIPFNIPKNWKFVFLQDIAIVKGGKRIPSGSQLTEINTGHKYIRVKDMQNGSINTESVQFIEDDIYEKIRNYTISHNDIYITVAGTIGRVGIVPKECNNANLTENADKICPIGKLVDKYWMYYLLSSTYLQNDIYKATAFVAQPKLAINKIESLIIPLPPLAEQKRIVARIEELLPLCEDL